MTSWGDTLARVVDSRLARPQASAAAITALKAKDRFDGMLVVDKATGDVWVFVGSSTATAGLDTLAPDSGSGRWARAGGGASSSGGAHVINCVNRSAGALSAYTRTGLVILADSVGALGAVDGITNAAGDLLYLSPDDAAAGADAGPYVVDSAGGLAEKFQLTRAPGADTAEEIPGLIVTVESGATYADTAYQITNNAGLTLGATAITDLAISFDLATLESVDSSIQTRLSAEECARSNTDSSAGSIETRLSSEECARSNTDSSVASIETRLSADEVLTLQVLASGTITSADLTAGTVGPESVNVGSAISQSALVLGYRFRLTDAFDNGAGVSLAMELGHTNDVDAYEDGADVFTGSAYEGAGWVRVTPGPGLGVPAFDGTATGQLVATFTAGADTLGNFTNGSVEIQFLGIVIA